MKRIFPILMMLVICFTLAGCGTGTISGDPVTYSNAAKSFSVDLPTADEGAWIADEKAPGNVLSLTDNGNAVKLHVQCLSKSQAEKIAPDLSAYKEYAIMNIYSNILTKAELKDAEAEVPEFFKESTAATFTYKDAKGLVVFMESEKCYYTYLIIAVEDAYNTNEKALKKSLLSFKEITETP